MWITDLKEQLKNYGEDDFYRLDYRESVGSTNNEVKALAGQGAPEGLIMIAEEQTAGRGRSGHSWDMNPGDSIAFTVLLRPSFKPERASALTLVMGLSCAQGIRDASGIESGIKWPNDAVVNGKKICGILTEMEVSGDKISWVVVGTGINVNNESFAPELADKATSLKLENGGRTVSRAAVAASVLHRFRRNYETYAKTEDLSGLIDSYNEILVNFGREVRIEDPDRPYIAKSRGIDRMGRLLVIKEDGTEEKISTGEVSVRGLYGYV